MRWKQIQETFYQAEYKKSYLLKTKEIFWYSVI